MQHQGRDLKEKGRRNLQCSESLWMESENKGRYCRVGKRKKGVTMEHGRKMSLCFRLMEGAQRALQHEEHGEGNEEEVLLRKSFP